MAAGIGVGLIIIIVVWTAALATCFAFSRTTKAGLVFVSAAAGAGLVTLALVLAPREGAEDVDPIVQVSKHLFVDTDCRPKSTSATTHLTVRRSYPRPLTDVELRPRTWQTDGVGVARIAVLVVAVASALGAFGCVIATHWSKPLYAARR